MTTNLTARDLADAWHWLTVLGAVHPNLPLGEAAAVVAVAAAWARGHGWHAAGITASAVAGAVLPGVIT